MTEDISARVFVIFILILYASLMFTFVVAGVRKWVWQPISKKFSPGHSEKSYHGIDSAHHKGSPS